MDCRLVVSQSKGGASALVFILYKYFKYLTRLSSSDFSFGCVEEKEQVSDLLTGAADRMERLHGGSSPGDEARAASAPCGPREVQCRMKAETISKAISRITIISRM